MQTFAQPIDDTSLLAKVASNKNLLIYTNERYVDVKAGATKEDVELGLADKQGDVIMKKHVVTSVPVLFDEIVEVDAPSEEKQLRGSGKIAPNLLFLHLLGVRLTNLSKSGLLTISYLMDTILPFLIMLLVSPFTKPVDRKILDRFYAKFHTPTYQPRERDDKEVEFSIANPQRFEKDKLFPNSSWEMMKPDRMDIMGFLAAFGVAVLLMLLAFGIANIKVP